MVQVQLPAAAARLQPLGQLAGSRHLQLAIGLPLRHQAALTRLLRELYDPASPEYHHFLTPQQFTDRFGPSEQDYQAVMAFARVNGLRVTATYPNRMLVDVNGSVSDIERALHVKMQVYEHPRENRTFYAANTEPSLNLAVPILSISGLNDYSRPRPRFIAKPLVKGQVVRPNAGSGPGGTYMGTDFRVAYVPDTTLTGAGQAVGLLEFDGYSPSDIAYYESQAGLSSVTLTNVLLDGFTGNPTGSGGEVEVSLDIEVAIAMAPGLSRVIVYEAGPAGSWHDILNRMASDDLARQLSCSWYIPGGGSDPIADQIWQEMAAQGQSFFNASGDSDAYTGLIDFPGDSPYITQVGGTTLTTSGTGGPWASETVWNWGGGIGSGGGISTQYPIPDWQTNIDMTTNQGSTTMRNTPDVALTADNVYVRADGVNQDVGGTSCAAPLWAGFTALVNQQAAATGEPAVGFINPAVDAIGTGPDYTACFHDITSGNNTSPASPTRFYAESGYDLCTGWGTPNGQKLINALANPEALQITPTTGFTSLGGVGGPFTVSSQEFTLTNVGTNTLSWTLSNTSLWLNVSLTGSTLAAGGPATNVTVSLNSVASNLVVGSYSATVWFTNLNDNVGQGRRFDLAVLSPPTITVQPTNQAVLDGVTATFSVGVTGGLPLDYQWQYDSNNLTDGGNISGSTTTNLTIANASLTNAGYYRLVVSNVAGVAISSNARLSIVPSPPVITVQPTSTTVGVGRTAQFSVAAVGTKPFSYQWDFNGTNLVGATNATLILTDVQFNQAGAYAVTITNIYGSTPSSSADLTVRPCYPVPAGILSWWPGEGNADDIVGTNNGIPVNVTYTNGEVGQAFDLNGTSAYVQIPDASGQLNFDVRSNDFTVGLWVNLADLNERQDFIIDRGTLLNQPSAYDVYYDSTVGKFVFECWDGTTVVAIPSVTSPTTNTWYYLAAVCKSRALYLYVNGKAEMGPPLAGVPETIPTNYGSTRNTEGVRTIGRFAGFAYQWYTHGLLDEVQVFNRALSSNEIAAIYEMGSDGECPPPPTPPAISSQPANQTVVVGQTATFSVSATGTLPLSYQWTWNTTNLANATNATLILTNVQPDQAGTYAVVVSNLAGTILSSNATLTVNPVPPCYPVPAGILSWWPGEGNADDIVGTNNGIPVNVTYTNGEVGQAFDLNGTSAYMQIPDASGQLNFDVRSNDFTVGLWVNLADLNERQDFIIDRGTLLNQPTSYDLYYDSTVGKFVVNCWDGTTVVAIPSVTSPTTNTWYYLAAVCKSRALYLYVNGKAEMGPPLTGVGETIPPDYGSTRNTEGVRTIGRFAGFAYQSYTHGLLDEVQVFNRALSSNEIAAIYDAGSVGECPPQPAPPAIGSQPTNQTVLVGQTATFTVSATGTLPLSYQWTWNTTNLANATNATLILTNVQPDQAGAYAVVVSNLAGAILSSNATLTVLISATIATQPTNQTAYVGGTASFSVTPAGTPPFGYQWNFNQTNLVGATNATLVLTNVQPEEAGPYRVLVTGPLNSILSSNAVLTVNLPPALGEKQSSGFALIYWPVSASGFVLEVSPSLSPANWVPVSTPPIQIGSEYLESIQMTGTNEFYRLHFSGK